MLCISNPPLYNRQLVVSKGWPLYTDFTVVSMWHTSQETAQAIRLILSSACATVHWVKHYRPECVLLVSKPLSFVNSCNYSSLSIDQWCCTWLLSGHLGQYSSDMTAFHCFLPLVWVEYVIIHVTMRLKHSNKAYMCPWDLDIPTKLTHNHKAYT